MTPDPTDLRAYREHLAALIAQTHVAIEAAPRLGLRTSRLYDALVALEHAHRNACDTAPSLVRWTDPARGAELFTVRHRDGATVSVCDALGRVVCLATSEVTEAAQEIR